MASIPVNQQSKDQLVKTARKLLRKKNPGQEIINQFVQEGVDPQLSQTIVKESIEKELKAGKLAIYLGFGFIFIGILYTIVQYSNELSARGKVELKPLLMVLAVDVFIGLFAAAIGHTNRSNAKM